MKVNRAFREWVVDLIKRSGAYRLALQEFRNGSQVQNDALFVSEEQTISRKDISIAQPSRKPVLWRMASSSGTSGQPLVFPQPLSALQSEQAFIDALWIDVGFQKSSRVAVMRGIGGFDITHRFVNRLVVSSDGWDDGDIHKKLSALVAFRPEFIDCYPSILERFILRCIGLGINEFPQVKGVFAGSESCNSRQEDLFLKYLGAPTVSWYGLSEQVALGVKISEDEHHFFPQYSDLAFIKSDLALEIVGRSKLNPFFSKQWYRTGDFCDSVEPDYNVRFNLPVLKVKGLRGRNPEYIEAMDGNLIPFNHIVFGLHGEEWLSVTRYCFVQECPGIINFYYAENNGASAEGLIRKLRARIPSTITLVPINAPELNNIAMNKWRYYWPTRPAALSSVLTNK